MSLFKCEIALTEIIIIHPDGIMPRIRETDAIMKMDKPRTLSKKFDHSWVVYTTF